MFRTRNVLRWLFLFAGLGLLGWILTEADLDELVEVVSGIGWSVGVILAVYLLAFIADTFAWQLAIPSFPLDRRHLYRAWKVRMVGELFNAITPLGNMGGEPVKAALLKRHHGIGLGEGTASVIVAQTVIVLSLILFLAAGFALMAGSPVLPSAYKNAAGVGLAMLAVGIGLFFLVQRFRVTSVTGHWLSSRRIGHALQGVLHHIHDVDDRLVRFYAGNPRRFVGALICSSIAWLLGVAEIYVTMDLLGHPISVWDAWIIESAAQMVRAGTFLIPASLGAQDGAFLLVTGAMTGQPALGLAVALIRRFREIVWLISGALIGWSFAWRADRSIPDNTRDDKGRDDEA